MIASAEMEAVIAGVTESLAEFLGGLKKQIDLAVAQLDALEKRLAVAEQRPMTPGPEGPAGKDGVDGKAPEWTPPDIEGMKAELVSLVKSIPPQPGPEGRDGRDVDMTVVTATIHELVTKAVGQIPPPKDGANGADGTSVTVEEVRSLIQAEVEEAVKAIPVPKDGAGVVAQFIDRDGHLVLTLSDGRMTKSSGPIVGRDGRDVDLEVVRQLIVDEVAKIPRPKDGADGVGWDEVRFGTDEHGRAIAQYVKGDEVKTTIVLPSLVDRGVWRPETKYLRGSGVTWAGSYWIAQADTIDEKPGEGATSWRMAVRRGDKGAPGLNGKDGEPGRPGRDRDVALSPFGGKP